MGIYEVRAFWVTFTVQFIILIAFPKRGSWALYWENVGRISRPLCGVAGFLAHHDLPSLPTIPPVGMTRKVVYGYRYNSEKVKRKGTIRSKIYFDMWKDKDPYYVIHRFLYENDPNNKNFKYDIDLATKPPCTRNIFDHYKKDNKLRFFWYASGKKSAKGPCSRYINFAMDKNEFRFSKLKSYYHILPYVHENYKDDPRYIYYMNRFLSKHGRVAEAKREFLKNKPPDSTEEFQYRRSLSWKEIDEIRKREENEVLAKYREQHPILVDLGNGRCFTVKPDGFSVHGEYYSRIDKTLRKTPYDIYHPYYRTKESSKRRRFRERGRPLNPEDRCKTRKERLRKNALKRLAQQGNVNPHRKSLIKQKKSFTREPYYQQSLTSVAA
ncbi:hypothetical protein BdWA1_001002 [Babesia duncani]|uniref:Uncharacterized protein n=1 Tax=Babesia duncani TaxID=323732 RepID=A0AAD9PP83_9APIC|nr:hypothetical protein BdWA1_001002 [Babesia duncani]